jgi:hypothetical protein
MNHLAARRLATGPHGRDATTTGDVITVSQADERGHFAHGWLDRWHTSSFVEILLFNLP